MSLAIDSEKIKQNGWRQGAFLFLPKVKKIFRQIGFRENELYVVLSQDCDILNSSLKKEPTIELLLAKNIENHDPGLCDGKNPRQLHLGVSISNQQKWLEFFPHSRIFLPRKHLEDLTAFDCKFDSSRELTILIKWIVKRYKRPAFPDEFNRRIDSKTIKLIKSILGREENKSLGLFIRLNTSDELPDKQNYKLIVCMLVRKENYENKEVLALIEKIFDDVMDVLLMVKGIEVIEGSQILSKDDITLHRYEELKQWDFDYISFANGKEGDTLMVD